MITFLSVAKCVVEHQMGKLESVVNGGLMGANNLQSVCELLTNERGSKKWRSVVCN